MYKSFKTNFFMKKTFELTDMQEFLKQFDLHAFFENWDENKVKL
jgi:hypothetical protein